MKKNLFTLTVLLFTFHFGFTQNISGVFSTDFNELTLSRNGNKVTGTYKHQNGRIEGILNGHTLTGLWVQNNGKGKFVFEFNNDFSAFFGKWGYNDAIPTGKWDGKRIGGGEVSVTSDAGVLDGVFTTDFNELTFNQNGRNVTGTYKHRNGRIEGTLNGRTLTGLWFQDNGKGKFVFEFNSDFSAYTGKWGYNDAEPTSKWDGKRTGTTSGIGRQVSVTNDDQGVLNGVFSTDFNEMTLTQNGNTVTGTYKHLNGRIEGTMNGHTLTGFWFQSNGKGKFVFEFNSDFSAYTGKWGYNDAEPSSKWDGKRTGQASSSAQPVSVIGDKGKKIFNSFKDKLQITANGEKLKKLRDQVVGVPSGNEGQELPSDIPAGKAPGLNVDLNNSDAVAGDLKKNAIQLDVSKGTFDQKTKLEVKEAANVPQFDSKRASLIGAPLEITIDQKVKRLNNPVIVKLKLDKGEVAALQHSGDMWMGYFNGKKWDYFRPLEVNTSNEYVKFETYHFSVFAKANPTKEEMINNFAYQSAVNQWAGNESNALTKEATERIVTEILSKKMGIENKSLTQNVVEAIMKENDYTTLMVNYNDGQMEEFSQNLALLAGKTICDVVTSDSNAKALLGTITDHSSKIGTGIQIAAALADGNGEEAAKALSMEILNTYPLTKILVTTAELTEQQINRWKQEELEAAYQVFVKGAESSVPFWGYQVEPGKFDQVWDQLRGLEAKLMDDAIKNYAELNGTTPGKLNSAMLAKIRKDTKENLRQEFTKRRDQEAKIETIKAENIKLVREFEGANLLARERFGFSENTSFDFRLERLFRIKDMILKDTKSRIGFTGVNSGGVISSKTVAYLIQLWYSEDGKEKYRKELVRLGYKKEVKTEPVTVSNQAPNVGGPIEGVWVGTTTHTQLLDYWGNPRWEWVEGVPDQPILFVVYNAGNNSAPMYRALALKNDAGVPYIVILPLSKEQDNDMMGEMLPGLKNGSFSYRQKIEGQDGNVESVAYRNWKASQLKTPLSTATYPASVSIGTLQGGLSKFIAAWVKTQSDQPKAETDRGVEAIRDRNNQKIQFTRDFYAMTPVFQRAAEKWLKERKFNADKRCIHDRAAFKAIFEKLLKETPIKK